MYDRIIDFPNLQDIHVELLVNDTIKSVFIASGSKSPLFSYVSVCVCVCVCVCVREREREGGIVVAKEWRLASLLGLVNKFFACL